MGGEFSSVFSRPGFLKSGQLITGQTGLIYKGKDGTGRVITPDSYITRSEIGDIGAMNDELVLYGKNMIADAITYKGVSTVNTDTFEQMASNIRNITGNIGVIPNASDIMLTSNVYAYAYWKITEGNTTSFRSVQGYFNNDTDGLKSKLKSTSGSDDGHCILIIPNLNLSAYNKIEMHRAYGYGNKTWAGAVTNSSAVLGSIIGDNSNTDSNCTIKQMLLYLYIILVIMASDLKVFYYYK